LLDLNTITQTSFQDIWSFKNDGILRELTILTSECILFLIIVGAIDSVFTKRVSLFNKLEPYFSHLFSWHTTQHEDHSVTQNLIEQEDVDVREEDLRVSNLVVTSSAHKSLLVHKLTKRFKKFLAVDNLTFGVEDQECFGLLGANGAGKTTTFQLIVGELLPTSGNAYFNQTSLNDSITQFQSQIGYCPQFDALNDFLTGSEMLYLFARLRGIPAKKIEPQVDNLISMIGLSKYANKTIKTYSGGNKRKLSLAVALIGLPPLLLLDEPTSGIDPLSRRKIWRTLGQIKDSKQSIVILTTHSMEECEALCSRLAIMVNGKFRCVGSLQHLKCKFSQGYRLQIKLKANNISDQYIDQVQAAIRSAFPKFSLKDYHLTTMEYHLEDTSLKWSDLFKIMEEIKLQWDFEDYVISDTSLEQIFLMFAKKQMAHL